MSSPPPPLTTSVSVASELVTLTGPAARRPMQPVPLADDVDRVVAVGAVDDDRVHLRRRRRCRRSRPRGRAATPSVTVGAADRSLTMMVSAPPRALNSIASTSLRSMVTLAMSRVKRTRPPLAEMSMFSSTLAPLKRSVSVPAWPSTVSLPSPGSHWKTSSPAPSRAMSLPCLPSTKSLPSPPSSRSAPLLPRMVSLPAPPSTVMLISAARLPVALKRVVAAVDVDDEVLGGADVEAERRRDRAGRSARGCRWR